MRGQHNKETTKGHLLEQNRLTRGNLRKEVPDWEPTEHAIPVHWGGYTGGKERNRIERGKQSIPFWKATGHYWSSGILIAVVLRNFHNLTKNRKTFQNAVALTNPADFCLHR